MPANRSSIRGNCPLELAVVVGQHNQRGLMHRQRRRVLHNRIIRQRPAPMVVEQYRDRIIPHISRRDIARCWGKRRGDIVPVFEPRWSFRTPLAVCPYILLLAFKHATVSAAGFHRQIRARSAQSYNCSSFPVPRSLITTLDRIIPHFTVASSPLLKNARP